MEKDIFKQYKYKVEFKKVYNDHSRLRDDLIIGYCDKLPAEGEMFVMVGPPRDSGSFRQVNTSPIVKCMNLDMRYEIHTESGSVYQLYFQEQN